MDVEIRRNIGDKSSSKHWHNEVIEMKEIVFKKESILVSFKVTS